MGKAGKPKIRVTASAGLFYVTIEYKADPCEMVGPFRTSADAQIEKKKQKKRCKRPLPVAG